jgi:hypothetical protein
VIDREQLWKGKGALDESAVEANAGGVVGDTEVYHHLVHIREDLCEEDWICDTSDEETGKLSDGKRRHFFDSSRL